MKWAYLDVDVGRHVLRCDVDGIYRGDGFAARWLPWFAHGDTEAGMWKVTFPGVAWEILFFADTPRDRWVRKLTQLWPDTAILRVSHDGETVTLDLAEIDPEEYRPFLVAIDQIGLELTAYIAAGWVRGLKRQRQETGT